MKDSYTCPDYAHSALITIDTQNDFTLPGAPAEIGGTADVVPTMKRLLLHYRKLDQPIVHVVRLYRPDGSNVDLCRRAAIEGGARIVPPGTEGAELVGELKPSPGLRLDPDLLLSGGLQSAGPNEVIMYKPRWGAFYDTPLEAHLHELGINTLVFTGCNFPNCPRTSIYEASERDFRIVLVTDAVSQLYDTGLKELENIGVTLLTTSELINAINVDLGQHDAAS